jgi:hypothetical protein
MRTREPWLQIHLLDLVLTSKLIAPWHERVFSFFYNLRAECQVHTTGIKSWKSLSGNGNGSSTSGTWILQQTTTDQQNPHSTEFLYYYSSSLKIEQQLALIVVDVLTSEKIENTNRPIEKCFSPQVAGRKRAIILRAERRTTSVTDGKLVFCIILE